MFWIPVLSRESVNRVEKSWSGDDIPNPQPNFVILKGLKCKILLEFIVG